MAALCLRQPRLSPASWMLRPAEETFRCESPAPNWPAAVNTTGAIASGKLPVVGGSCVACGPVNLRAALPLGDAVDVSWGAILPEL